MPNHVTNLIVFENVTQEQADQIKSFVLNDEGEIDFTILLPIPLNVFCASFGKKEEERFGKRNMCNEWCSDNWSTKWNAYGQMNVLYEHGHLSFQFDTAWSAPALWMLALSNKTRIPFNYHYFDEGQSRARSGYFKDPGALEFMLEYWGEALANDAANQMMAVLKWGKETAAEILGTGGADE